MYRNRARGRVPVQGRRVTMVTRKLSRQLFIGYLVVMLVPLLVASWYTSALYKKYYTETTVAAEKTHAYLIGTDLAPLVAAGDYGHVDTLCKKLGRDIGIRITVVLPSGKVIGDSEKSPDSMENHANRPEIMEALEKRTGVATRASVTLRKPMMYVASPLQRNDTVTAVVRTAVPLSSIKAALGMYYFRIFIVALFMALCALLLSILFNRRITKPVRELQNGAERFAKGDFSRKIEVPVIEELSVLATALNKMADQLHERILTITRQRNEQEAILAGMTDGVIVIDLSEHIIFVNNAAGGMFGIDLHAVPGRFLSEVIPKSAIRGFAKEVLTNAKEIERDFSIALGGDGKQNFRFLQAHGTVLRDTGGAMFGAVIVVSDVTRLRRLEQVRKDFAANVSHELRTPLTTIKGFVETLQTGGLEVKDKAQRFLDIIAAQVERLSSIIDDLMTLTLIEREEEAKTLALEDLPVFESVKAAARHYEAQAGAKQIAIVVKGESTVIASINAPLIEQAVGNLIDNAIKYSGSGTMVEVSLSMKNSECVISVKDQGQGIPREHLDRLFERFYRVDKARSRKLGGTGLGLSIVKHIIGAHKGTVLVESTVGKGSTFSIVLPVTTG